MSSDRTFRRRSEQCPTVTIRRAQPPDALALAQLAVLDDAEPLAGETLVAEIDGELWAACDLSDGRVVSDPFRPAAEARALLELRAALVARPMSFRRAGGLSFRRVA